MRRRNTWQPVPASAGQVALLIITLTLVALAIVLIAFRLPYILWGNL